MIVATFLIFEKSKKLIFYKNLKLILKFNNFLNQNGEKNLRIQRINYVRQVNYSFL